VVSGFRHLHTGYCGSHARTTGFIHSRYYQYGGTNSWCVASTDANKCHTNSRAQGRGLEIHFLAEPLCLLSVGMLFSAIYITRQREKSAEARGPSCMLDSQEECRSGQTWSIQKCCNYSDGRASFQPDLNDLTGFPNYKLSRSSVGQRVQPDTTNRT
jgi:hypothetical protein